MEMDKLTEKYLARMLEGAELGLSQMDTALTEEPSTKNRVRNLRLAALIEGWLEDESQHDEEIGPELDRLLHDNPPSFGEDCEHECTREADP